MRPPQGTVRQIDVARRVGLSQRTISAVLGSSGAVKPGVSQKTAKRIREIAAQMGYRPYRPAQQMKGQKSGIIGVLIGAAEVEVNYRRLSAFERLARENGYRLMVGYLHDHQLLDEYVDDFHARDVEGVLCLRHEVSPAPAELIPQRLKSLRHVVYLDQPAGIESPCCVQLDRADGIRQAVEHLRTRRRQRIGLVLDNQGMGAPMQDRLRGYRDALGAGQNELVWRSPGPLSLTSTQIGSAIDDLIIAGKADAVLASNDMVAVTLIKALRRRGLRVPEDVAIVGYDNSSMGLVLDPELTTIDHQNDRVVALMLNMLLKLIRKGDLPAEERQVSVQPVLIARGTS